MKYALTRKRHPCFTGLWAGSLADPGTAGRPRRYRVKPLRDNTWMLCDLGMSRIDFAPTLEAAQDLCTQWERERFARIGGAVSV